MKGDVAGLRASRIALTINVTGPFFERDPSKKFGENARTLMDAIAAEGAQEAQARIRAIGPHGVRTGERAGLITGRTRSHHGRRWNYSAVIGIPNAPGMSARQSITNHAAMAEIERLHHPIRDTTAILRASRAANVAELTKGLG